MLMLFARPRACTNTWLEWRFTPVWKDKHRLINKSVSLATCWPSVALFFFHTHNSRGQGQSEGRREVKVCCWVCLCVGGLEVDKTVCRVKALICSWGLGAPMFWQRGHELWPHQTLRDKAVWSGGTVATKWHNLPSPTRQSLFKQTSVSRGECLWVAYHYCAVKIVPGLLFTLLSGAFLLFLNGPESEQTFYWIAWLEKINIIRTNRENKLPSKIWFP